jgi:hypothetical protein
MTGFDHRHFESDSILKLMCEVVVDEERDAKA